MRYRFLNQSIGISGISARRKYSFEVLCLYSGDTCFPLNRSQMYTDRSTFELLAAQTFNFYYMHLENFMFIYSFYLLRTFCGDTTSKCKQISCAEISTRNAIKNGQKSLQATTNHIMHTFISPCFGDVFGSIFQSVSI